MANERLVSPGVFTRENDLSFLPQGIAEIGAGFIGPTLKGPAFRPVIVESQEDFEAKFGGTDPEFYTPYAVTTYLKAANRATIVRILGLSGYNHTTVQSLLLSVSGSGGSYPIALIHPSRVGVTLSTGSIGGAQRPTEFTLTISGANGSTAYTSASLISTATNFISNVLGESPKTKQDGFVYTTFPSALSFVSGASAGSGSVVITQTTTQLMLSGSTYGTYRNARTPLIRSQLFGSTRYNLFRFYTLTDGTSANRDVKISITSIKPDSDITKYGTFSVIVRRFSDTDSNSSVLEQFDNLNLDPTSVNYIARRIGTARPVIDANNDVYLEGDYVNNSQYIYVEMSDGIEAIPVNSLPYGFAALNTPINAANVPAPGYITTRYYLPSGASTSVANNKIYYGFNFDDLGGLSYLNPIPSGSATSVGVFPSGSTSQPLGGPDEGFDLLTSLSSTDATDVSGSSSSGVAFRKFSIPFQNGFDGQNPSVLRYTGGNIVATNTQGYNLSDSTTDGSRAYKQAIDALSNPDAWDINLLVLPGVIYSQHPYIAQAGIDLCETRGDCFFIMDSEVLGATVTTTVNSISGLDTNYAGTFYPWIKIQDPGSAQNIWVPPSVLLPKIFAENDAVAASWFAPAGLNRGGIGEALQVRTRLDHERRDTLYENRVNPIAQFPGQGIVVWGQKTMQKQASAFDRISVRRLLIEIKKFIASMSRYLVFEQNVASTRQRFLSIVNPYLESVQERSGLYSFKVVMDETNNTPDIIDRNMLVAKIELKPTKTAEYIVLEFNVLSTGATFSE